MIRYLSVLLLCACASSDVEPLHADDAAPVDARPAVRGTVETRRFVDTHDHYAHAAGRVDAAKFDYLKKAKDGTPAVALTFDCAWVPEDRGLAVLDALREKGVKATFFISGPFVLAAGKPGVNEATQRVVRRIVEDGHEVGNHTKNHPHATPQVDWGSELSALVVGWDAAVARAFAGASVPANAKMLPYWRAPFGEYDARALGQAAAQGFPYHFGWNVDARDALGYPSCKDAPQDATCMTAEKQTRWVLRFADANPTLDAFVVLAHLGGPYGWGSDPKGIRALVDGLRARGRTPVRLSEIAPDL